MANVNGSGFEAVFTLFLMVADVIQNDMFPDREAQLLIKPSGDLTSEQKFF